MKERFAAILFATAFTLASPAATLPTSFAEIRLTNALSSATAMALAPDGRIFVCEQGGALRVIKNGALLPDAFLSVTVNSMGERGLLGIAFDPNFATNNFVYVYYTATTPAIHNRVSRFTANGDVAVSGSETILLDLDNLSGATNHNGGALHFGPDGSLYIAVGENANGSNAQTLANLHGKILRINADGTIPLDNPFYNQATGRNRAIWALGLRNPFTFAFQNGTGRMFINDVGQNTWEEINDGLRGANYGWPTTEGETTDPRYVSPLFVYGHISGPTLGCAITGGAFYNPPALRFPSGYVGTYFFADYCSGWIRRYDPAADTATGFATGAGNIVDLAVSSSGKLYYLNRSALFEIDYTANEAPQISTHPQSQTKSEGKPVTFSVTASGTAPLSYQWERNMVSIPGATSQTYTINSVTMPDNGAQFRCVVTNTFGSATSNPATLTVVANQAPTAAITSPAAGTLYSGGQTIAFTGNGTDPEDGALPASAYTWTIDFHHDTHTHPAMQPTSGITTGTYTIPDSGETSANVFYRIYLTVSDSAGLPHTTSRDVQPRTGTVTLASSPAGAQLTLDGQPVTAPILFLGVAGIKRTINAPSPQTINAQQYLFQSWSDGGAQMHVIATPAANTTFTASFARPPALSISKSHTGNFTQGQTGALYTVTVSNAAGVSATTGAVTVVENVPAGLSLVSMAGTGWACSNGSCTRSNALAGGVSYPAITVTVNVSATAPSSVTNRVTVSGGGSASATATDPTVINPSGGTTPAGASFITTDTTTRGNWKGTYGGDGAAIYGDVTSYPGYAEVAFSGQNSHRWASSTTDVRALQKFAAPDRIASTWYSATSFTIDINLTDGNTHQVSLYCLDWDTGSRAERIDVVDAASNAVLDTRTISAFNGGQYLVWNLKGNIKLRITRTGAANAVVSGLFFGASPVLNSATFIRTDSTTQGTWKGTYGADGAAIYRDVTNYPAYAQVSFTGQSSYQWASSTNDVRALQKFAAPDRIATTWYSATSFTIDINLTDGNAHQVALYCLDWDSGSRAERIDVLDAASNAVLDTRTISAFQGGQYLVWSLKGNIKLRITRTGAANAVVSGLFFR